MVNLSQVPSREKISPPNRSPEYLKARRHSSWQRAPASTKKWLIVFTVLMAGVILGFLIVIGSVLILICSMLVILGGGICIMKKLLSGAARGMGIGARSKQRKKSTQTSTGSPAVEERDGATIKIKSITGRIVDTKSPTSPTSSE